LQLVFWMPEKFFIHVIQLLHVFIQLIRVWHLSGGEGHVLYPWGERVQKEYVKGF
jgi:hypothetical protein